MTGSLTIVGLGPGAPGLTTPAAAKALAAATDLVGYDGYLARVPEGPTGQRRHSSDNREEIARARHALTLAAEGRAVTIVWHDGGVRANRAGAVLDSPGVVRPPPECYAAGVTTVTSAVSVTCRCAVATGVPDGALPISAPAQTSALTTTWHGGPGGAGAGAGARPPGGCGRGAGALAFLSGFGATAPFLCTVICGRYGIVIAVVPPLAVDAATGAFATLGAGCVLLTVLLVLSLYHLLRVKGEYTRYRRMLSDKMEIDPRSSIVPV